MEIAEVESELLNNDVHGRAPHGLRTLVVPKVLLPPGRVDLAGKVSEVVRGVFPLAASPFRQERLAMEDDWAVADGASRCPECSRGSKLMFSTGQFNQTRCEQRKYVYSWRREEDPGLILFICLVSEAVKLTRNGSPARRLALSLISPGTPIYTAWKGELERSTFA
ncbi:hypothetical protein LXA43DRAFT_712523 [Ganoderma leucocontextum]|nr:hypothetical protein LXA43DRAFT_712523 [Ganoderma leucocontextum]